MSSILPRTRCPNERPSCRFKQSYLVVLPCLRLFLLLPSSQGGEFIYWTVRITEILPLFSRLGLCPIVSDQPPVFMVGGEWGWKNSSELILGRSRIPLIFCVSFGDRRIPLFYFYFYFLLCPTHYIPPGSELGTGGPFAFYLPPIFEKRQEVLFWGLSPYPPAPPSKSTS